MKNRKQNFSKVVYVYSINNVTYKDLETSTMNALKRAMNERIPREFVGIYIDTELFADMDTINELKEIKRELHEKTKL